jgi:hypothetical protein
VFSFFLLTVFYETTKEKTVIKKPVHLPSIIASLFTTTQPVVKKELHMYLLPLFFLIKINFSMRRYSGLHEFCQDYIKIKHIGTLDNMSRMIDKICN